MGQVHVEENEPIDKALKRFKKECQKSGIPAELRRREHYEKPSERRRREELKRLYERAGIPPSKGLRSKEPLAQELGLARAGVTDDEILDAMVAHPILIDRPLVETDNGVRLCRPQDKVREIL